jgi:hypothetical protein
MTFYEKKMNWSTRIWRLRSSIGFGCVVDFLLQEERRISKGKRERKEGGTGRALIISVSHNDVLLPNRQVY